MYLNVIPKNIQALYLHAYDLINLDWHWICIIGMFNDRLIIMTNIIVHIITSLRRQQLARPLVSPGWCLASNSA